MEISDALNAFSALSQETRLKAFKKLVECGTLGRNAGDLAADLGVPANTLSFHLSHLANANLITSEKTGREVLYRFNILQIKNLISFLNENCCLKEEGSCLYEEKIC